MKNCPGAAWLGAPDIQTKESKLRGDSPIQLVLSGASGINPELADALYKATSGDIEFEMREGVATLEFERASKTLREAILSAIRDVEGANAGVRVIRVKSDSANTIAKINAELLGVGASD